MKESLSLVPSFRHQFSHQQQSCYLFVNQYNLTIQMSDKPVLLQIINYLTSEQPPQPRNLLLQARYQHSDQLPLSIDLLILIYSGQTLRTRQGLIYPRLFQLLKSMLSSADLLTTLLLTSKLFPTLSKAKLDPKVPKPLQEMIKQGRPFSKLNSGENKILSQARKEACLLLQWCQRVGYFSFYFHLLNKGRDNPAEHLDSFMLQVASDGESPWSEEEMKELRVQLLTQCEKLTKQTYREEALKGICSWLKQQSENAFIQSKASNNSLIAKEGLSLIILTHHDLTCAALVHTLKWILPQITFQSFSSLLSLVDELIVTGNTLTAIHALLILTPLIFLQILRKNISIPYQIIANHYQLWNQAMERRQIKSKLLFCQLLWLPIIFKRQPLDQKHFAQTFQLFRGQLAKLYKESQISQLKVLLEDIELKSIEQIYQQMEPFHSQIQALEDSKSSLQQKPVASIKASSKIQFSFKASEASEKDEIKSLMQSLRSSKQGSKTVVLKPNNQEQLKIYSKRHSIKNSDLESQTSITEEIHSILNFLEILQGHPVSSLSKDSSELLSEVLKIPFLPILSKNSQLEEEQMEKLLISEDDPYGVKDRGKVTTKVIELKVVPLRFQLKRKIVKNRGLIIKNTWMELGYLIDSQYRRRRLTLYITFQRRVESASVVVKEKSLKLWKKGKLQFIQPKMMEQYQSMLQIEKIKLYQLEGIEKSHRFIRPKIQLSGTDIKGQTLAETHEIPIYLYNMLEWLEIPNHELYIFDLQPLSSSEWLPFCHKIIKNKDEETQTYFPLVKLDKKGNLCLKFCLLHEVIFAKVYLVLQKVKVVLINSDWDLALMALLEMVLQE